MVLLLRMVLTLQGLTLPSLDQGLFVTSRLDCVSKCILTSTCESILYDSNNDMCHILDNEYGAADLTDPSPGHQYLFFRPDKCPADCIWIRALKLCYKIFEESKTWHDAEAVCVQDGGHLLKMETDAVNSVIRAMLAQKGSFVFWIGGTDEATENTWLWADGSAISSDFWYPYQPEINGITENCMAIGHAGGPRIWHDYPCSAEMYSLCQIQFEDC